MAAMKAKMLYLTASSKEEGEKLGEALVEKRLAACVNILEKMSSIYRWEGKVERADEVVVLVKTTAAKVPAVMALTKAMHSYDCPCVLEISIDGGNPDYLNWITESVS